MHFGRNVMAQWLLLAFCALVHADGNSSQPAPTTETPNKEALRYDGKPFVEWRAYLRTELKAERRVDALRAMAAFGANGYGEEAATAVLELFSQPDLKQAENDDVDKPVVDSAVRALKKIGPPGTPALVDGLKHRSKSVRLFAAGFLVSSVDVLPQSAIPTLIQATQDEEQEVRFAAILALTKTKATGDALKKVLKEKSRADQFVRDLVGILQEAIHEGYAGPFAEYGVRTSAGDLIGEMGPWAEPAVPALLTILRQFVSNKDYSEGPGDAPTVNFTAAASALGGIGTDADGVIPVLAKGLAHRLPDVREGAVKALGRFGLRARPALPAILECLKNEQELSVLLAAAIALDQMQEDTRKATEPLLPMLRAISGSVHGVIPLDRALFYWAAGERGPKARVVVPLLLAAFKEFEEDRPEIADALANIGSGAGDALPVLNEALRQGPPDLRRAAAAAIDKIKPSPKK